MAKCEEPATHSFMNRNGKRAYLCKEHKTRMENSCKLYGVRIYFDPLVDNDPEDPIFCSAYVK